MKQEKSLGKKSGIVAVSYDPTSIFLRRNGRENIGNVAELLRVTENGIFISKPVADHFGLEINPEVMDDLPLRKIGRVLMLLGFVVRRLKGETDAGCSRLVDGELVEYTDAEILENTIDELKEALKILVL